MEKLRQEFLSQAISNLEGLRARLQSETFSENFLREIFRAFHTVKGNSHVFGLNAPAKLAHEIENLLQAKSENQIRQNDHFANLLLEGVELQIGILRQAQTSAEFVFPAAFAEKIRHLVPHRASELDSDFSDVAPPEIVEQLSAQEKKLLAAAVADGKSPHLITINFEFADFEKEFKAAREILGERGEIVASFPNPDAVSLGKIGFRFFFLSRDSQNKITELIKNYDADFAPPKAENDFADDTIGVLAQIAASGEKTARKLGKKVTFETRAENVEFSAERLKLVFDILSHLVRNAVDHAIEKVGRIKIELRARGNELLLRVSDDGRGIDAKKIKMRAVEKNLISADANLSDEDLLKLIFTYGFSTAESVTETSGRGVGLDAVNEAIKGANGKISVKSEPEGGTVFEILLPKNDENAKLLQRKM